MAIPIDNAVRSLVETAHTAADAPRLTRRLSELQSLLGEDLAWLENALEESTSTGSAPGRDAARHLVRGGGKRIRPIALLLSTACFGPVTEPVREMALVSELIHSATLLHDDVVDDGHERRGVPSARLVWGNAVSVLAGDLLLVEALSRTERTRPDLLGGLITTLRSLVDGEITQLRGRRELDLEEDTYERILRGKTASLFRWATSTGAQLGGAIDVDQDRLGAFGELLGMAFQLVDDALDYTSSDPDKTPLADLREGKPTLPLVLAAQRSPELVEPVRRIHAGDDSGIADISRRVVQSGACEEVRGRAARYTERALAILDSVRPSSARSLLKEVALELVER